MKWFFVLLLFSTSGLRAQAPTPDPSIFDGTGTGGQEVTPPPPGGGGGPSDEENPEAAEGEGEPGLLIPTAVPTASIPEGAGGPGASVESESGEDEPTETDESTPGSGMAAEEEGTEETPDASPGTGAGKSRAGETFTPSEKIPPAQAVDFPWDI